MVSLRWSKFPNLGCRLPLMKEGLLSLDPANLPWIQCCPSTIWEIAVSCFVNWKAKTTMLSTCNYNRSQTILTCIACSSSSHWWLPPGETKWGRYGWGRPGSSHPLSVERCQQSQQWVQQIQLSFTWKWVFHTKSISESNNPKIPTYYLIFAETNALFTCDVIQPTVQ